MSKKISAFTELAAQPATTDLFLLELASSGAYRKIKWSNVVADGSITTAKLADLGVTTGKINTDAVTATKIDWASTGADGGIWWEELGRTTLGSAGDTLSVASLPVRKYLKFYARILTTGTVTSQMRFNNDSGSNYAHRYTINNGVGTSATTITSVGNFEGGSSEPHFVSGEVINVASEVKHGKASTVAGNSTVGTAPNYVEFYFKWVNTTNAITRIDFINSSGGDLASGSELVVLGHN